MEPQQQIDMLADLPTGNDKESRRQRRLMRNRLSAQRSRDKRRRDIEVYTKLKAQKVEEIASMKKTVTEEMEGLKKLEEMVKFAKTFLGPAKFATVNYERIGRTLMGATITLTTFSTIVMSSDPMRSFPRASLSSHRITVKCCALTLQMHHVYMGQGQILDSEDRSMWLYKPSKNLTLLTTHLE
eukprot:scaffold2968_cov135-Skeletonema_dohrnii-CCMP3373.AAC.2